MLLLHELKQVLVLVKQFSFINRNVCNADTILMVQYFPIQLFVTDEFSQSIEIQQIKWSIYSDMQLKSSRTQIHLTLINGSHDSCFLL